ncbi:hypothetical protein DPH57_15490 [Massilia sp. YMA4]|nr:hypothetical protein DPH57_15490 [Massilia sp. YMA4]
MNEAIAGDAISGTFVIDTSAKSSMISSANEPEGQRATYTFSTPQIATFKIDRTGFVNSAPIYLTTVRDHRVDSGRDGIVVEAGSYFGNGSTTATVFNVLALELNAPYDTISTTALPTLAYSSFQNGDIIFQARQAADATGQGEWHFSVSGHLTSVSLVSAVPEPATYAMLLAGFGLLGWRARARR